MDIGTVSWKNKDLINKLKEFSEIYSKRPIKHNAGGMLSPHMFYTWFITQYTKFDHIIESGIWKGQSTWLFEQALPDANIFSIDINLSFRKYISKDVKYLNKDFTQINWSNLDKTNVLCFFDDHQDALPRIKYCKKNGFKYIIFEDNYPIGQGDCVSIKQLLEKNGKETDYLKSVIKTHYVFPPIFKNDKNRWGVKWDIIPIKKPLLTSVDKEYLKIYKKDAHNYTWLCYVELK